MIEKKNEKYSFPDPAQHPEWISPQSDLFYSRLVEETGEYKYPWKSTFDEPTAEMVLEQLILSNLPDKNSRILDVGCGHGEFTSRIGLKAKEVVGIDITDGFINTASRTWKSDSVRFFQVNADERMPFTDNYFDIAYTKKGPTNWFREGNRVVKQNGLVVGLYHAGTDGGLRTLFPGLYAPLNRNESHDMQVLEKKLRLSESGLNDIQIHPIEEIEYLSTPEDVLYKKCFGQSKKLKEYVWNECLKGVEEIFYSNATSNGLRVVNYFFVVTARAC